MKQDSKLMKDVKNQEQYNELSKKIKDIYNQINRNTLHLELDVSKKYLMDVDFLRKTDKILTELDKSDLTKKGIIGSEINDCNEILLT